MREEEGKNFLKIAREACIPFYATIELTHRCNLSCAHCYLTGDHGEEMTTGEVCDVIDQLAECGTMELTFTGGEPLLRDDFFEITSYARLKNMACSLLSNGTLINEEVAGKIKEQHFLDVSISIYGPESHDRITGVKGSYLKSWAAVKLLRQKNVTVQVKAPVMSSNVHEIEITAGMCDEIGVDYAPAPMLTPKINGLKTPLKYRLSDKELKSYLIWSEKYGLKVSGFNQFCNAGRSMTAVSPAGDVFPCLALRRKIGNLREISFKNLWWDAPYLKWLRGLELKDFKECSDCLLRDGCALCPGETLEEEGDLLVAHKEACRIAKIRKEVLGDVKEEALQQA